MTNPNENARVHYMSTLDEFCADIARLLRMKGVRPLKPERVLLLAEYFRNKDILTYNASTCATLYQFIAWELGTNMGKLAHNTATL